MMFLKCDERGITLVEVLATLVLLSLVTGVIWSTISLSAKLNVAETSTLRLQQESNYIIAELQKIHRKCDSYTFNITKEFVEVSKCENDENEKLPQYDGIISSTFNYGPITSRLVIPAEKDLTIEDFRVSDILVVDGNRKNREVVVTTVISRYLTQ